MSLKDKIAVITGAANGIGKAGAQAFAEAGARLVLTDIDDEAGTKLAGELAAAGADVVYVHMDVSSQDDVEKAIATATDRFGKLDILYNNAGGSQNDGRLGDIEIEDFWATIRFNLFGTWLCCRTALPALIASGGGVIVNTTSFAAIIGWQGKDAYTASKGGISAITRSMAVEYAGQGIRVNAIAPGMTITERAAKLMAGPGDHGPSVAIKRHVLGLLSPKQVADTAVFLASDASSGMTGQILTVDSGYTIA